MKPRQQLGFVTFMHQVSIVADDLLLVCFVGQDHYLMDWQY